MIWLIWLNTHTVSNNRVGHRITPSLFIHFSKPLLLHTGTYDKCSIHVQCDNLGREKVAYALNGITNITIKGYSSPCNTLLKGSISKSWLYTIAQCICIPHLGYKLNNMSVTYNILSNRIQINVFIIVDACLILTYNWSWYLKIALQ